MEMVQYLVQFLIGKTCICAKLVSDAHANRFIKSCRIYFCVFIILYLKATFLNILKIMKRSSITKYSDKRVVRVEYILQYRGNISVWGDVWA